MKAATAKMALAETKAETAQRLADNDLTLTPAVVKKSKPKAAAKTEEKQLAPVAAPPSKKTVRQSYRSHKVRFKCLWGEKQEGRRRLTHP